MNTSQRNIWYASVVAISFSCILALIIITSFESPVNCVNVRLSLFIAICLTGVVLLFLLMTDSVWHPDRLTHLKCSKCKRKLLVGDKVMVDTDNESKLICFKCSGLDCLVWEVKK